MLHNYIPLSQRALHRRGDSDDLYQALKEMSKRNLLKVNYIIQAPVYRQYFTDPKFKEFIADALGDEDSQKLKEFVAEKERERAGQEAAVQALEVNRVQALTDCIKRMVGEWKLEHDGAARVQPDKERSKGTISLAQGNSGIIVSGKIEYYVKTYDGVTRLNGQIDRTEVEPPLYVRYTVGDSDKLEAKLWSKNCVEPTPPTNGRFELYSIHFTFNCSMEMEHRDSSEKGSHTNSHN
jgi:hypothetical protein